MEPIWEFIIQWSNTPAAMAILALTAFMKSKGVDLGKFNFVFPMVWGLLFGALQAFMAPKLGYLPFQSEFWPIVTLGICTGLQATLWHTIGKNTIQGLGGKK